MSLAIPGFHITSRKAELDDVLGLKYSSIPWWATLVCREKSKSLLDSCLVLKFSLQDLGLCSAFLLSQWTKLLTVAYFYLWYNWDSFPQVHPKCLPAVGLLAMAVLGIPIQSNGKAVLGTKS